MKYMIFGLIFMLVACKEQLPSDFDPLGKLVYVEALDNKDGLMSGEFGEIFVVDPKTKQKFRLTYDNLFDEYPTWFPDGSKVMFTSRRTGKDRFKDLTDPSRIFEVELKSLKVQQADLDYDANLNVFKNVTGTENYWPVVNRRGTELGFFTNRTTKSTSDRNLQLVVHNLKNDSFFVVGEAAYSGRDLRWSDDGHYLAYSEDLTSDILSVERAICIVDRDSQKTVLRIGEKKRSYNIGAFYGDKLYYTGCASGQCDETFNLYVCDLRTMQNSVVHSFKRFRFREMTFADNTTAYILRTDLDMKSDVYLLDIRDGKTIQITTDGNVKSGLDYLREKKK